MKNTLISLAETSPIMGEKSGEACNKVFYLKPLIHDVCFISEDSSNGVPIVLGNLRMALHEIGSNISTDGRKCEKCPSVLMQSLSRYNRNPQGNYEKIQHISERVPELKYWSDRI